MASTCSAPGRTAVINLIQEPSMRVNLRPRSLVFQ